MISWRTVEIREAIRSENPFIALIEFLAPFDYLNYTDDDAIEYGTLKTHLRRSGNVIGPIDMLLVSQALARRHIMVTNNTKEFYRVPNLNVQDWTER